MFGKHVSRELSAYCHDELAEEESRRVAEHLMGCSRCRCEFDEIKAGVRLAEQLPSAEAPAELWAEIQRALDGRPAAAASRQAVPRPRSSFFRWPQLAAAC